ncbi:MAG: response regulator [Methyloprofundus sp.]|nr:response regulator [Methyloprofundus sp.]MDT8425395.1 response regulator [Methyloprofundus sp.]
MMKLNKQAVTIYIVDDEFSIRDSLSMLLELSGFKAESYESAQVFLEHFDPDQPGCLILDMRMPDMDGLELQEELVQRCSELPIIFISGHGDVPISAKAFKAGAVDFIEKPFDNQLLLARIDEVVDKLLLTWPTILKKKQILERYASLTSREKEIFLLIVHNNSSKEAAQNLKISNRTVDVHRAHIMRKMQADSLSTLIMMAVTGGIL